MHTHTTHSPFTLPLLPLLLPLLHQTQLDAASHDFRPKKGAGGGEASGNQAYESDDIERADKALDKQQVDLFVEVSAYLATRFGSAKDVMGADGYGYGDATAKRKKKRHVKRKRKGEAEGGEQQQQQQQQQQQYRQRYLLKYQQQLQKKKQAEFQSPKIHDSDAAMMTMNAAAAAATTGTSTSTTTIALIDVNSLADDRDDFLGAVDIGNIATTAALATTAAGGAEPASAPNNLTPQPPGQETRKNGTRRGKKGQMRRLLSRHLPSYGEYPGTCHLSLKYTVNTQTHITQLHTFVLTYIRTNTYTHRLARIYGGNVQEQALITGHTRRRRLVEIQVDRAAESDQEKGEVQEEA